jgi:NADH-quinone oxidoreductase subunit E
MSLIPVFDVEERGALETIAEKYEDKASAILPALHYVQSARGYLGEAELVAVADLLEIPHVRAYEVATYFTMFSIEPRGRHLIQICRNLGCRLVGAPEVLKAISAELGVEPGQTTTDSMFTLVEVECIGACDKAPAMMVDEKLFECVTPENIRDILASFREVG